MFLLSLFCATAVLGDKAVQFGASSGTGYVNHWDGDLSYSAPSNHVLTGIHHTFHSNKHEDRVFSYYVTNVGSVGMTCPKGHSSGPINYYDGNMDYACPNNQAVSSVYSHHVNHSEDRIWDVTCCDMTTNDRFYMNPAHTTAIRVNNYDGSGSAKCPSDSLLIGFRSVHNNHKEDRVWEIYCRRVLKKTSGTKVGYCFHNTASNRIGGFTHVMGYHDINKCYNDRCKNDPTCNAVTIGHGECIAYKYCTSLMPAHGWVTKWKWQYTRRRGPADRLLNVLEDKALDTDPSSEISAEPVKAPGRAI